MLNQNGLLILSFLKYKYVALRSQSLPLSNGKPPHVTFSARAGLEPTIIEVRRECTWS